MNVIDCVVIGFNEVEFDSFIRKQEKFKEQSGAYYELQTSSVLLQEKYHSYMDLLNYVLTQVEGKETQFNAFEMPNLGVAYLVSFLKKNGLFVEFVNFFNFERQKLVNLLLCSPKSVVITTTYYVDDEPIKQIIKFIRQYNSETKIIVGGPRIFNICYDSKPQIQDLIFKAIGADVYINDSQGESTLLDVIKCIQDECERSLENVPNLIYKQSGRIFQRTKRVIENNNLNENIINWKDFDRDFYVPTVYMRTARSCPFSCAFCNYPTLAGSHVLSDITTIESEMKSLSEAGVKNIIFVDDTFNVPLPRFKEICRMMIRNKFHFNWVSFFRCSNSDDETFELMKESGCLGVYLGIESGDQQILKNMNKFANLERYRYGIKKLSEHGILTLASLIVGFPGENEKSVLNTIEFLESSPTTFYNVQLYYHNTLAPIQSRSEDFGIIGSGYSWKHNSMDWQTAVHWMRYMIRNMNKSVLLPLYSFSIWTLPYLMDKGISIDNITDFARSAKSIMLKNLYDSSSGSLDDLEDIISVFQKVRECNIESRIG